MNKVKNTIVKRVRSKRRGWVFSPKDFLDIGNRDAIDKVLSRLTTEGMIRRISRGIYDFPKQHKVLGALSPPPNKIARVMAAKSANKISPSGAMAANILGLSTQVPAKPAYLTNGASKVQRIGKQVIKLRHAHVPLLDNAPDIVNLTIQALFYLGKNSIDDAVIHQCAHMLSTSDIDALLYNARYIPGWIVDVVHKIKQEKDGQIRKAV